MSSDDTLSPAEARRVIEGIARGNGWISKEAREATPKETIEAYDRLQEGLGAPVKTLVEDLYRSESRFLLELIQNADDNDYTRATSNGAKPYICFTIYPDRIIVDSNEDGFTVENVRAICKIRGSTKTRTDVRYIGEKGIGFKSVFMIASKVHVQSGPFSFFFQHGLGDSGMGMITPEWEEPKEFLPNVSTRITLTLLNTLKHSDVLSQFGSIPETLLLFLNKLRRIEINKIGFPDKTSELTTYACSLDNFHPMAAIIRTLHGGKDVVQTSSKYYHTTRKTINNLPPGDQRGHNTVDVVLAFQVNESVPVVGPQEVYSYLPIHDFGFHFLIQPDFTTDTNRQYILETPRNQAILEGIAETFLEAVLQFCDHPTLQYQWPKYVPHDISEPFWRKLQDKIHDLLKASSILRGWNKGPFLRINQLKLVPENFKGLHGDPLSTDLSQEVYLAPSYVKDDCAILQTLGLLARDYKDAIARLRSDLQSSYSRYKSKETQDNWHTQVANLLLEAFEAEHATTSDELCNLPLFPLQSGEWSAIAGREIFLPDTDGMPIPTGLDLRIVDSNSLSNPARKKLFIKLGLSPAPVQRVRNAIALKHSKFFVSVDLESSVKHLHYLYWTTPPVTSKNPARNLRSLSVRWTLWIFNDSMEAIDHEKDLYFPSDGEYDFQQLLGHRSEDPNYNQMNQDSIGSVIHPMYLKSVPMGRVFHPTWEIWLELFLGISRRPRLADPKFPRQLSEVFRYIINRRPDKVLGTLKAHWTKYNLQINADLAKEISGAAVPNTNLGTKLLRNTFLPLKNLTKICGEFLSVEKFPFLKLGDGSSLEEWKFLELFHVGVEDNLDFYLNMLESMKLSSSFSYSIYEAIQWKIWGSITPEKDGAQVRDFIRNRDLIAVPTYDGRPIHWTYQGLCRWDAPAYMTSYTPLLLRLSEVNSPVLTAFFKETLRIPDVSWSDLTYDELGAIKNANETNLENVRDIYRRLQSMSRDLNSEDLNNLRTAFEKYTRIFVPTRKFWAAPSSCLWLKDAYIPGKNTISEHYQDLKDFFTGILKLKIPDLVLLVEELKREAAQSPIFINNMKSHIWQINALEPTKEVVDRLGESYIFPTRGTISGKIYPRKRSEIFCIRDHQPWADKFEGKVDFLDFNLKEVRMLQPFLSCFDLESRYLSRVIVEKSAFYGFMPNPSPERTMHFRRRAYALSRCATHFNSPRAKNDSQTLYQLLCRAKVFETDGITGILEFSLMGQKSSAITFKNAKFHVEEKNSSLNIFVPETQIDREICYLRHLPTRLFNKTMMGNETGNSTLTINPTAIAIIASVFMASDSNVDSVLEEAGIIPVPYPDQYKEENKIRYKANVKLPPAIKNFPDAGTGIEPKSSGPQSGRSSPVLSDLGSVVCRKV